MTSTEHMTAPAVQALLDNATLAGHWTMDASASTVRLQTRHMWGLATIHGAFHETTGDGTVSSTGQVSGTVRVAASSVETGSPKRDCRLRSAEFFDVGKNPDIVFEISGVRPAGAGVDIGGNLTVRGITRPVTMPATVSVSGDNEVRLNGDLQVDRSEFGLTWNKLGMASMKNTISVHAVFTKG